LYLFITYLSQLAEAILSEPTDGGEDARSIRLTDSRTFRDNISSVDEEREHFLVGEDEEREQDQGDESKDGSRSSLEDGEDGQRGGDSHPFGNHNARVSRLDISGLGLGNGVGHGGGGEGEDGDDDFVGEKSEGGRLSAKAGIILVRFLFAISSMNTNE
jgi:hypothetical protein